MGFPNNEQDQAVPAAPKTDGQKEGGGGGGPLSGIVTWIGDSYNGLYKIVLKPSMPTKGTIAILILGAIIGLIWAWALFPVVFTGANPHRLNDGAQEQWVKMIAVAADADKEYGESQIADLLNEIPEPRQVIQRLIDSPNTAQDDREALATLQGTITAIDSGQFEGLSVNGTNAPDQNSTMDSILQFALIIILLLVVTPIVVLLWRLLIYDNIVAPIQDRAKQMVNKEYAEQRRRDAQRIKDAQEALERKKEMINNAQVDESLGKPVMTQLAIYTQGRDFDESYEIELPQDQGGDFLGQSGAVLAESIAPDPVAIEVWLFDMFSQQDLKKVFITEAGNNDPAIRGRIAGDVDNPDTDIIVARQGSTVTLDSEKLRLEGKMATLDLNANGRFENFKLEVRAWRKDGGGASAGASAPPPLPAAKPLPDYSDMTFDPPPAMPTGGAAANPPPPSQPYTPPSQPMTPPSQPYTPPATPPPPSQAPLTPPSSTGGQRLSPPPLRPPSDDDDPFGGTGDFTPLGN